MSYTIGQLATRSGITVRALRHYDQLNLLPPSGRSPSGYRRYTEADVQRLHRILAYRQIGLPLKDIARHLARDPPSLRELLGQQLAAIQSELSRLQHVALALRQLAEHERELDDAALSDQLLQLMRTMQTLQQHYTPEELAQLQALRDTMTPERRQSLRDELAGLIQAFGAAAAAGEDPASPGVLALAQQWKGLGRLMAPSPALRARTRELIDSQPAVQQASGITPALKAYIDQAVAGLGDAAP